MTGAALYPLADSASQWYGPGNAIVSPNKLLWHTTETAGGWPDYAGGTQAPNLTYDPWKHAWRQHFGLNGTARALANAGDFHTNRAGVCQVEVSAYCDPARFSTGFGVDRLDDQAYEAMAAFAQFMLEQWGIPPVSSLGWKPYPASYGAANGVRLSTSAFTTYTGHLAHMHAPGNDHGDAGGINITRILTGPAHLPTGGDDVGFTVTGPDNSTWFLAGVERRLISWDQANALAGLSAPATVPYLGYIPTEALEAYRDVT